MLFFILQTWFLNAKLCQLDSGSLVPSSCTIMIQSMDQKVLWGSRINLLHTNRKSWERSTSFVWKQTSFSTLLTFIAMERRIAFGFWWVKEQGWREEDTFSRTNAIFLHLLSTERVWLYPDLLSLPGDYYEGKVEEDIWLRTRPNFLSYCQGCNVSCH